MGVLELPRFALFSCLAWFFSFFKKSLLFVSVWHPRLLPSAFCLLCLFLKKMRQGLTTHWHVTLVRLTDSHAGDKFSVSQVRHEAGLFLDGLTRMTEWCGRRGAIRRIRARVVGATDGAMSMWTMDA